MIAPMVAEREPALRAIELLAGVARSGRTILQFQLRNLVEQDTSLSATARDSAIAAIPARIDSLGARDPWMKFFIDYGRWPPPAA